MAKNTSNQVVMLFRFIRLFGVSMFRILRVYENHVDALVAWEEDCQDGIPEQGDTQNIRWKFANGAYVDDALTVGEFAYDMGWISSDKATLDEIELQNALGWNESRIKKAIGALLMLKVQMIDDGEETDSFFLHI